MSSNGSSLGREIGSDKRTLDSFECFGEIIQSFPPFETCKQTVIDLRYVHSQFDEAKHIANINADYFQDIFHYSECFLNNKLMLLPDTLFDSVVMDTNNTISKAYTLNDEFENLDIVSLQISWNMLSRNIIDCEFSNRQILESNKDKLDRLIFPRDYSLVSLAHSMFNHLYYRLVVKELENIYTGKNIY